MTILVDGSEGLTRYGCFDAMISCDRCGEGVPVNGVLSAVTCGHCFTRTPVPPKRIGELFEDFEEEQQKGTPGPSRQQLFAEHDYHFNYRPEEPRCPGCKQALPEVQPGYDGLVTCTACGWQVPSFPPPAWLRQFAPSAVQLYGADRDTQPQGGAAAVVPTGTTVALQCPACGAALHVAAGRARLAPCDYCHADVYLPDEVWARLHPLEVMRNWYVRFEGWTRRQLDEEQRRRDRAAEMSELPATGRTGSDELLEWIALGALGFGLLVLVAVVRGVAYWLDLGWSKETSVGVVVALVLLAIFGGLYLRIVRPRGKSKAMLRALAWKYGLSIDDNIAEGVVAGVQMELEGWDSGGVTARFRNAAGWSLDTRPPGSPAEGLVRFFSGDAVFDRFFPIRYAKPETIERLRTSHEALAPIQWFMARWGTKLSHLEISWQIRCSLRRGARSKGSDSFLPADEMEPLLLDVVALARALDGHPAEAPSPAPHAQIVFRQT